MLLTTYLNQLALNAFTDKAGVMPPGAIVVKETGGSGPGHPEAPALAVPRGTP